MTASGREWNAHSHPSIFGSQSAKFTITSHHSQVPLIQWSLYTRVSVKCYYIIHNIRYDELCETLLRLTVHIYLYHTSAFILLYYLYIFRTLLYNV